MKLFFSNSIQVLKVIEDTSTSKNVNVSALLANNKIKTTIRIFISILNAYY